MSKLHIDRLPQVQTLRNYPDDQEVVVTLGMLREAHRQCSGTNTPTLPTGNLMLGPVIRPLVRYEVAGGGFTGAQIETALVAMHGDQSQTS